MLTAVTSTRIFCQSDCPAPPPRPENVLQLATVRDCVAVGCRPCKRCQPMHDVDAPDWLDPLLKTIEENTANQQPLDSTALRKIGLSKQQIGRWFAKRFDFTFDAYCRMRRLAKEIGTTHFQAGPSTGVTGSTNVTGRKVLFQHLLTSNQTGIDLTKKSNAALLLVNRILTPLGPMVAIAGEDGICLLEFADRRMLETNIVRVAKRFGSQFRTGVNPHIIQLGAQLKNYFAGNAKSFTVPLADQGTDFQTKVWHQLKQIPFGTTKTYSQVAININKPTSVRAVGRANGDNRLSILIPCHRLIGADGSLTGYGGGLQRKQWLLDHESKCMSRTA